MIRAAWLTDVHLNFLTDEERADFLQSVVSQSPDVVLLGGDIAESPDVVDRLLEMDRVIQRPIYFVLGNHDFYRGAIAETRQRVAEAAQNSRHLVYLTKAEVIELTADTALVGDDGWADGRLGDFFGSRVRVSDFRYIDELKTASKMPWDFDWEGLYPVLQRLGDEAAEHLGRVLPEALDSHRRVIVLTHVPPFREAAWHKGRACDDDWLPFFACKAVGDVLCQTMQSRPDRELLVLCGHTHSGGRIAVGGNIRVWTGEAEYGAPVVQEILEID